MIGSDDSASASASSLRRTSDGSRAECAGPAMEKPIPTSPDAATIT